MIRHFFWMGLSTFARLASGVLTFVLIARMLGPQDFGRYMFWFSATYLTSLVANYGLGNLLLREIGAKPALLHVLIARALSARLLLSVTLLVIAGVAAPWLDAPYVMLLLLVANLGETLSETFFVAYRAVGAYSREAAVATATAVSQLVVVLAIASIHASPVFIAAGYCSVRLTQLMVARSDLIRMHGAVEIASVRDGIALIRQAKSYALDFGLGNLFGHIDSVILRAYVGVEGVGLYQAGMRVLQGCAQLAPILGNVLLPKAAQASEGSGAQRIAEKVQLAFVGSGALMGVVLTYCAPWLSDLFFGHEFSGLKGLLPLFGMLLFLRFFAASWGLVLTAHGYQQYRAISTFLHFTLALILGVVWIPRYGTSGWLWAMICGTAFLGAVYMLGALRVSIARPTLRIGLSGCLGGFLFLPYVLLVLR